MFSVISSEDRSIVYFIFFPTPQPSHHYPSSSSFISCLPADCWSLWNQTLLNRKQEPVYFTSLTAKKVSLIWSWVFGIHDKFLPRVSSSSLSLSPSPSPALQRMVRKVRGVSSQSFLPSCKVFNTSFLCTFSSTWASCYLVFVLFCFPFSHFIHFSSLSNLLVLFPHLVSLSLSVVFPCLTLPFLPAPLSGVFQTFGACQEPPGMACLSAPFTPIRSDTGTQIFDSSQQQLQED